LSPSVVSHPRLVLKPMTAVSSSKCRCLTVAKESNDFGDSSLSTNKSRASGIDEKKFIRRGKKATSGIFS